MVDEKFLHSFLTGLGTLSVNEYKKSLGVSRKVTISEKAVDFIFKSSLFSRHCIQFLRQALTRKNLSVQQSAS